ncbi:hypothetical protein SPBR_06782 [Sporothrix brasiliensis 5110]|uniref:MHD domain-containing protein n=1 Tax=Sporothrix brasiliensis 5110 TaxID=1398154 RepID=A0A0C2EPJ7_9PEZI|nr:uncharacterized protein SPBR_06782 [Sporothrix brasiliensis 5110]KIH88129.1 hypothetical protein SPBR_06782 [Sporothrix brasiliensis 5110]
MDGVIEALHIFDEHNAPILSHTYTGRPLSAAQLLPLYLDQQRQQQQQQTSSFSSSSSSLTSPSASAAGGPAALRKQPASLVYISDTNPPTLVFSIVHAGLLLLLTTSSELEPLLALEFLHRVADALEEFLGSPLLASKIEASYEVVAQLLTEMCDAGTVGTTEPDALHDLVEVEGLVGKLLGSITLPGKAAAALSSAAAQATSSSLSSASSPNPLLSSSMSSISSSSIKGPQNGGSAAAAGGGPALPWRRANVRHTSNEMYADVVESLSVTLAPSGRPLAAFAQGSIAFTAKVSGLPDILLTLTGPSGKHNLGRILELPVFHPCVRLARWKERPGELSFVPPDGRFLLAAYEVDLMPFDAANGDSFSGTAANNSLRMPINVEIKSNLGPVGADFAVRATINRTFAFGRPNGPSSSGGGGGGGGGVRSLGGPHPGSPGAPLLEDVRITVPLPADVRNLLEIRPTRGDAVYNPGERVLEWHIPAKDVASGMTSFGLQCTVVGQQRPGHLDLDGDDSENSDDDNAGGGGGSGQQSKPSNDYGFAAYTDDEPYQDDAPKQDHAETQAAPLRRKEKKKKKKDKGTGTGTTKTKSAKTKKAPKTPNTVPSPLEAAPPIETAAEAAASRKIAQNKILMPSSASVSFSVKGWLASGIRVESIVLDTKRSRGLGDGVRPFKGVKYVTVSKGGIELRC